MHTHTYTYSNMLGQYNTYISPSVLGERGDNYLFFGSFHNPLLNIKLITEFASS